MEEPVAHPSFGQAARFWVKLGFINFGGPGGQIAIMHAELVERRRWISEGRFLHALNYCMLLPGPEAQQLATYIGWLLHGTGGGLVAGLFFIIPSFFLMLVLAWTAAAHGDVAWVAAVFEGLGAAVVGIIAFAVIRVGRKSLKNGVLIAVAIAAFLGLQLAGIPFPVVIVGAGLVGVMAGSRWPALFEFEGSRGSSDAVIHDEAEAPSHARTSAPRAVLVLSGGLLVWWGPLLVISSMDLGTGVFREQAFFFSKAALVTFGGAYAVLAYVNQASVTTYGWVTSEQMVTGLGLAESTPGPLIMVAQFVGFLGAWKLHGDLSPLASGIIGSFVVVWATFAPCFLWVFLGAPYAEALRGNRRLNSALSAITAAVVGVIASLAVTFGVNVFFGETTPKALMKTTLSIPVPGSINWFSVAVATIAFLGLWRLKWSVVWVILGAAIAGLAADAIS